MQTQPDLDTRQILTISHNAWSVVGLDDAARYPDLTRVINPAGQTVDVIGARSALIDLVTELDDRATEGGDGFNESARNKAICRRAVARARKAGFMTHDDLKTLRRTLGKIAGAQAAAHVASEPHVIGTEAPTPENDPVGRFRRVRGPQRVRPVKVAISIRLEQATLDAYRETGHGWQARMSADLAAAARRRAR